MPKDYKPLVSAYCLAYNHGLYIRDALEGFVNQKTNFSYEVFVHDDASDDNTQEIIREYEKKYPHIIKGIYQKDNQYSKGIPIVRTYIAPLMQGKYIATCEGDDYWIDENKLQKQFDVMEGNKNLSACVHNTIFWFASNNKKKINYSRKYEGILPKEKIFKEGGSAYHTSSVFMRKEYLFTPKEFSIKHCGDYSRAIYLGLCGDIYYFKKPMSVSRRGVPGSWSKRIDREKMLVMYKTSIEALRNADAYSQQKYHDAFYRSIRMQEFLKEMCENGISKQTYIDYQDVISEFPIKKRVEYLIKADCPKLYGMIKKGR
jgi:glycosyltransferase involved in cell wall biosynthesis